MNIIHGINREGPGLPKEELSCHDGSFPLSISCSHLFSLPFLCLLTAEGNSELCKEKMLSSTEKVMRLGRILLCGLALLCCRVLLRGKHALYRRESPIQAKPRGATWRSRGIILCLLLFFQSERCLCSLVLKAFYSKNTDF